MGSCLSIDLSEATLGRYMPSQPKRPLPQSRRSFLQNHAGTATIAMFVVATASFRLHAVIVLDHHRRCIIHGPLPGVPIFLPELPRWPTRSTAEASSTDLCAGDLVARSLRVHFTPRPSELWRMRSRL